MTLIDADRLRAATAASAVDVTVVTAGAIGRAHRRCGRGGQDAVAVIEAGDVVAAVVCDGCSAGKRSDVGAGVGARFVAADIVRRLKAGTPWADLPRVVLADLTEELAHLVRGLALDDGDVAAVVEEHLLFTVQAAVVHHDRALVFGVGDGVVSIAGEARVIDEGPAPDYPAYALFQGAPRLRIHHDGAFTSSVAVCSDGASELIAMTDLLLADGTALGGLAELERGERYVKNASLAQKRFHSWCDAGGPVDDCTVAVIRRAKETSCT